MRKCSMISPPVKVKKATEGPEVVVMDQAASDPEKAKQANYLKDLDRKSRVIEPKMPMPTFLIFKLH